MGRFLVNNSIHNGVPEKVRFVVAGLVNTLFGWLVFSGIVLLGTGNEIALAVGTIAGTIFNFITFGSYVFKDFSISRLPRFLTAYLFVFLCNAFMLSYASQIFSSSILAQLLLSGPMAIISYFLMSKVVFNRIKVSSVPNEEKN